MLGTNNGHWLLGQEDVAAVAVHSCSLLNVLSLRALLF